MSWLSAIFAAFLAVTTIAFGWMPCCCGFCCASSPAPVSITLTVIKSGSRACDVCYGGLSQTALVSSSIAPWGSATFQVSFVFPTTEPGSPCSWVRVFRWGCGTDGTMKLGGPGFSDTGNNPFDPETTDNCIVDATTWALVGSDSCDPVSQTWTGTLIHDPFNTLGSCACAGDTITCIITGNY